MAADKTPPGAADPRIVVESWNTVARGYAEYWTPRFRPFLERAIAVFEPPARGPIAVPGCGPGDEVRLLLQKFPGRTIFATDPSAEMVSLAGAALRQRGETTALVTLGRAEDLSSAVHQAAGVLSCFTLQLLPDVAAALLDWSRALRVGGVICAVFWPRPAPGSSYGLLLQALQEVTRESRPDWEPAVKGSLPSSGLQLERDEPVSGAMSHESPEELFGAIVERGPLQPLLRRQGQEVVARARSLWLKNPGLEQTSGAWINRVEARLWVMVKVSEPEAEAEH